MSGISTFGAFTAARLGIYAAQKGLDVTGHNIANINTVGYTRQRLDQMALRLGGAERYASAGRVGSGVLCTGISQLRDPYLDIRFRNESANVGAMDSKLSVLEDLSSILDEVYDGKDHGGILEAAFNDIKSQLDGLALNPGQGVNDGAVRTAAETLTDLLNSYADKLETMKETQASSFKQEVDSVNTVLTRIRDLNDSIFKSELHGDSALEMKDERNRLLDELSQSTKITIEYQGVSVGAGAAVDKLIVKTAGNPSHTLVDGSYCSEFSIKDKIPQLNPDPAKDGAGNYIGKYLDADGNPTDVLADANMVDNTNYDMELGELKNVMDKAFHDIRTAIEGNYGAVEADADAALAALNAANQPNTLPGGQMQTFAYEKVEQADGSWAIMKKTTSTYPKADIGDNDLYGSLQATREMLTEAGEYTTNGTLVNVDANAATKRGIPYYQNALDSLAQKFASVFNEANSGYLRNADGNYVDKTTGEALEYTAPGAAGPINIDRDTVIDADMQAFLDANAVKLGGNLFSNSSLTDSDAGISAANITISKSWAVADVRVVNSFIMGTGVAGGPVGPNSTATDGIIHLASLFDAKHGYDSTDVVGGSVGGVYANESFQGMLAKVCSTLASDKKTTITLLNNYASQATELNSNRDSVSGVDLNDEATSLMQYQKSYSAACRLMTTLDEALDKLINGTGVVGR